jgi:hypothetical protein
MLLPPFFLNRSVPRSVLYRVSSLPSAGSCKFLGLLAQGVPPEAILWLDMLLADRS